jgi:hypothetical protein
MTHENTANFVYLLNIFIKHMSKQTTTAGVINVINQKNEDEKDLMNWDLLYYTTTRFTMKMVDTLRLTYKNLRTINVVTDYHHLKT